MTGDPPAAHIALAPGPVLRVRVEVKRARDACDSSPR